MIIVFQMNIINLKKIIKKLLRLEINGEMLCFYKASFQSNTNVWKK